MARGSKKLENALFTVILVIAVAMWLFQNHPIFAIALILLFVVWIGYKAKTRNCQLCSSELKRRVYHWTIDGKKTIVSNL
ncbi:hypothetical protein [Aliivibrio fischeri]|uniref:hypothetical protein n=1 Tax=Aliivibrio fischeri TaxID=668 RepID=UPI00080DAB43|nr:hypothetical protein [Aliivibrio fischeri]OCH08379.1 hypothetical protein A6E10_19365 [Aliivibrio fischeri]